MSYPGGPQGPQRPQYPQSPYPPPYPPGPGYPPPAGNGHPYPGAVGAPPPPGYAPPPQPGPFGARPGGPPPAGWGYAPVPAAARPPVKHSSHAKLIAAFVAGLLVIVGAFLVISHVATPSKPPAKKCPPACGQPPTGPPVASRPRFTAPDRSFSVEYPQGERYFGTTKKLADGVLISVNVGDTGAILIEGGPANGRTAEQVATSFVRSKFPDARRAYGVPNALVGYQLGYGEVDDVYLQSSDGTYSHQRLTVLAAVKNDVSVLAVGLGAYHPFVQGSFSNGHPSGAATLVAQVMDSFVNSVTWRGDPPR